MPPSPRAVYLTLSERRTNAICQNEELAKGSHQYGNNPEQEDEGEGETSGYASDSGGTSNERNPDYWNQHRQERYQNHDNWMSDSHIHDKASGRFNKQKPWIPPNRYSYEEYYSEM
jgi:hypothetical protein